LQMLPGFMEHAIARLPIPILTIGAFLYVHILADVNLMKN